jgi:hypothetical protein
MDAAGTTAAGEIAHSTDAAPGLRGDIAGRQSGFFLVELQIGVDSYPVAILSSTYPFGVSPLLNAFNWAFESYPY